MDKQRTKEWLQSRELVKEVSNLDAQVICTRTKLKEGSLEEVKKWFQTLYDRREELLAFTEEGISLESVFIEKIGDDYFLIFYARSSDFKKTYEAIQKAMLPITVYHFNCWQTYCEKDSEVLELIFDLQRDDNKALAKAAERYVTILNKIGASQGSCPSEEIAALCAKTCKKVRNGKVLFEGKDLFAAQLEAGKKWLGAWSIHVQEMLLSEENHTATIHYKLATEKEGDLIVLVILHFDSNYLIDEINEVHNRLEKYTQVNSKVGNSAKLAPGFFNRPKAAAETAPID